MSNRIPPIETWLAARTAEMLALPQFVCRRRNCRRKNACTWRIKATGEPCCLRNLNATQRRTFDDLYDKAHFAQGFLGTGDGFFEARRGPQRHEDDVSIEIARTSPIRWVRKQWDAARRQRERWRDE